MQREHRGHIIRFVEGAWLSAELVERESGVVLPTTVTASAEEGCDVLAARACELIDIYLESRSRLERRTPARRPASLILVQSIRP